MKVCYIHTPGGITYKHNIWGFYCYGEMWAEEQDDAEKDIMSTRNNFIFGLRTETETMWSDWNTLCVSEFSIFGAISNAIQVNFPFPVSTAVN